MPTREEPACRDSGEARPRATAAVSSIILACLGLQILAITRLLSPPQAWKDRYGVRWLKPSAIWPFIDYPMYAESHREGETLPASEVVATADDGSEVRILPEDRTVDPRPGGVIVALILGDRARADAYCEAWRTLHGRRLVSLRLEPHLLELTRDGFVPAVGRISDSR